jgi:hypothetical protein
MVLELSNATFFPLSFRVAIVETVGKWFLTDGNRFVEYSSFEEAFETKITQRKLFFGEELESETTVVVLDEFFPIVTR